MSRNVYNYVSNTMYTIHAFVEPTISSPIYLPNSLVFPDQNVFYKRFILHKSETAKDAFLKVTKRQKSRKSQTLTTTLKILLKFLQIQRDFVVFGLIATKVKVKTVLLSFCFGSNLHRK